MFLFEVLALAAELRVGVGAGAGTRGAGRAGIVLQGPGASDHSGVGVELAQNWRGEKGLGFAGEVEAAGSTEGRDECGRNWREKDHS